MRLFILDVFLLWCIAAVGQETVFNVPSGDILDRGKVYGELDLTYRPSDASGAFTPRTVVGVGHRVEIGINVNGIGAPGPFQTTPTPTIKWKAYDGGGSGWSLLLGDDVFLPVQNRSYQVGNYVYAEVTKVWKTKTRATFGGYEFTPHVVSSGHRAGGQFAIEQPVTDRVILAADRFTGHHDLGFFTPGVIVKLTPRFTAYATYQISNSALTRGNHQFLMELGWTFN